MDNQFIQDAKERRKKYVEELTLKVLAEMLKENVRYLDTHYIQDRSMEIIEKTITKLKFSSQEIETARKAFIDVLLDGAKKQLYGFKDDRKEANKNLKSRKKKAEAIEVLKKLDRLEKKVPQDRTEQRDMECEPVCQLIASEVLSKDLMLKDEKFVNECIEMDNEMIISTLYRTLFGELFDQLISSLDNSYKAANEQNWGCRRDEIRMKQIDNRIKK